MRDNVTGCGLGLMVRYWDDESGTWGPWQQVNPTDPPDINGVNVVDCGDTTGAIGCQQECIVTYAASPGCAYVRLGSSWYRVCI